MGVPRGPCSVAVGIRNGARRYQPGMSAVKTIATRAFVWLIPFMAGVIAFGVWFAWKWGAHDAGVWWRTVRERLDAGDTTINQASWFMRDRWETLGRVWDGPKLHKDELPSILGVIGVACMAVILFRVPGAVLAGWLGRRAIRRDMVACDPALARRLGRRTYVDGVWRWTIPAAIAWGAAVALMNHLWFFSEFLQTPRTRIIAMASAVVVLPLIDIPCSLRWARHLISTDIRGRQRLCRWCGFDITRPAIGLCPECGKPRDPTSKDAGVRLLVRPRAARTLAVAAAFLLLVGGGIGWAVANANGIRVLTSARHLIDAVMMQRARPTVNVLLPVGRLMEVRVGTTTLHLCLQRPRLEQDPAPGGTPVYLAEMRVVRYEPPMTDPPGPGRRETHVQRGNQTRQNTPPQVALGPPGGAVRFDVYVPEMMERPGGRAYLFEEAQCWLQLPRTAGVARLIVPDLADADDAWLTGR